MTPPARRGLLAIAAVVDIALHARPAPVSSKALAARHALPARHLEPLLQLLVREGILKGLRGPRGGYELARERRRVTAGEIMRAVIIDPAEANGEGEPSGLIETVVAPELDRALTAYLAVLDAVTVEELCRKAKASDSASATPQLTDFTI